ncbi:MAG TPA: signal peptidase I [Verrucomicrobiae bacterium]|nr:signal peptidase I [Verrucomicrobiae bacterium]
MGPIEHPFEISLMRDLSRLPEIARRSRTLRKKLPVVAFCMLRLGPRIGFGTSRSRSALWASIAAVAIAAVGLLRWRFCLCLAIGHSMWPTLASGDLLLLDRWAYVHKDPSRGDIIVGRMGRDLLVKRVVGLPGEEIEINAGLLFVNGSLMRESHTYKISPDFNIGKGKLFKGSFATLGDNRAIPPRQAVHPIFSSNQIVGRVLFSLKLWPFRDKDT